MAEFFYGSICLSNVPKRLFKKVMCKDGKERVYLNIKVVKRREPSKFGNTHFVSCEPKDEKDRIEGETYIFGDLTEYSQQPQTTAAKPFTSEPPTPMSFTGNDNDSDLPF